jgi:protein-S-isoprenylcysteine O-methyltransferase Ste14
MEHQATAAVWQISRVILVVAGVMLPWHFGASAVTALWISSVMQAGCIVAVFALMIGSIEQFRTRRRG